MMAYLFWRLSGATEAVVMPAFNLASISTRATVIGPLAVGLEQPVQRVWFGAKDTGIVNMAAMASFNVGG